MKTLIAIFVLTFSVNASAIDVTITFTASQATRFAAACGSLKGLPIPCTTPESKAFIIERLRLLVYDVEKTVATKTSRDAIVIPAFDPS